ncbi:MAG: transglycosylase SLT domain-containing protein [Dokdonella sp.]
MSKMIRLALLIALVGLGSCVASDGIRPNARGPAKTGDAAVDALYAQLDGEIRRYQGGLDAARRGDQMQARKDMTTALNQLRTATISCDKLTGCDSARFYAAYDRMLRLNLDGVAEEAALGEDEVPQATATVGEQSPALRAMPELGRSITLLKGKELSEVIAVNAAVKAGIAQWLTQYRPNLMTAYVNYQYMRYQMWPEYHRAGLPEAILFGFMAKESGGKVHAVSRSGAAGLLQFMPATGTRFGLGTVDGFDQRYDPARSARANADYVNEQLGALNNDLELVLAAYNGGEGRMRRLSASAPNASFWDPQIYSSLAPETRDYVPMVLAAAWLFLHPERYNLNFPSIDGRPGRITLTKPASLVELTVCFGQVGDNADGWFRPLRNLNARYEHDQRLPAGTQLTVPFPLELAYPKACSSGKWQALAADLQLAIPPPAPIVVAPSPPTRTASASPTGKSSSYVVRKGDTLNSIARKNSCSDAQIAKANKLRAPRYALRSGQRLILPACS